MSVKNEQKHFNKLKPHSIQLSIEMTLQTEETVEMQLLCGLLDVITGTSSGSASFTGHVCGG